MASDEKLPENAREEAAKRACRVKCKDMTTGGHVTAFNALKDLDTEGHKHYRPQDVAKLKEMGYNRTITEYCIISGRARLMPVTVCESLGLGPVATKPTLVRCRREDTGMP